MAPATTEMIQELRAEFSGHLTSERQAARQEMENMEGRMRQAITDSATELRAEMGAAQHLSDEAHAAALRKQHEDQAADFETRLAEAGAELGAAYQKLLETTNEERDKQLAEHVKRREVAMGERIKAMEMQYETTKKRMPQEFGIGSPHRDQAAPEA